MPHGDKFLPPPYNYIYVIDFQGAEAWSVPSDKIVCEVRVVAPSNDTDFILTLDTAYGTKVQIRGRGENIWRIQPTRIWRVGSNPSTIRDRIEVYGYDKLEVTNY